MSQASAIDFGSASYQDRIERFFTIEPVQSDFNVTAKVDTGDPYFVLASVATYNVSWETVDPSELPPGHRGPPPKQKVYTQVGQSDGTTPLHVAKGQALFVYVTLEVPEKWVTPGPTTGTLTVSGDVGWGTATRQLTAYLVAVDEGTPIGEKWDELGGLPTSGVVLANAQQMPDNAGSLQSFSNGTIFYSPDFGAAWVSKPICDKLNSPSVAGAQTADGQVIRDYLGYPTGDSFATTESGGQAAYFEQGMIVLRANQQAFVMYGPIYLHYRSLGSIAQASSILSPIVGLPVSDVVGLKTIVQQFLPDGWCSHFDEGDIYWRGGNSNAWEIHGAIRDRWTALGGPSSFIGYPTSDEMPVMDGSNNQVGRFNIFEGGVRSANNGTFPTGQARIYWSPSTGAWEIYGEIKIQWLDTGGPTGGLGFPTSGETDTPGGGRYNTFQNGLIVWHADGPYAGAIPVGSGIQLNLFSYQDFNNSDFNVQINITDSNGQVNHGRMPAGGNYGNGNQQFNPPATLLSTSQVSPNYSIDVWMLCIHENTFGSDDEDGTVTAHFDIDNIWGETDQSEHQGQSFKVNMKPMPEPQVVPTDPALFRTNLIWPFKNFDTNPLSWIQFAETFTDVGQSDLDFNLFPWNWHLFERAFFQFVYQGLAAGGNCFGMCLEAIYSREFLTPFVEPIFSSPDNSYSKDPPGNPLDGNNPNDSEAVDQINIKHGYQLGADFVLWYLGQEMQDEIQDPVKAFLDSRNAFANSDWPLINLSPGPLSQDGHVVLPYRWLVSFGGSAPLEATDQAINSQPLSNQQWILRVANPNSPVAPDDDPTNQISIDPFNNTFSFVKGSGDAPWTGSKGSGGRIFSATFSRLSYEPHTLGDMIFALLVGGMVAIFSGDGQTRQVTDEAGRTYFAYKPVGVAMSLPHARPAGAFPSSIFQSLQTRTINPDLKTRVPNMTFVPLYHSLKGATATGSLTNIQNIQGTSAQSPFELYFVTRPAPGFKWQTTTGANIAARGEPSFKPAAAAVQSIQAGPSTSSALRVASGAPAVAAIPVKTSAPAPPVVSPHPSSSPSVTVPQAAQFAKNRAALINPPLNPNAVLHTIPIPLTNPQLIQASLTFEAQGIRTGSYGWTLICPRMSFDISSPTFANALDVITIGQPGTASQSITFQPDKNAAARRFNLSVAGWRGDRNKLLRWYALNSLALQPGQTFSTSVSDGGSELWINNPGNAATFDLTIYAGFGSQALAARSSVTVNAGKIFRIKPDSWNPATMSQAKIFLDTVDASSGKVVNRVTL